MKDFAAFLKESQFKSITVLSSISAQARPDKEISVASGRNIYFISNEEFDKVNTAGAVLDTAGLVSVETLVNRLIPDEKVNKNFLSFLYIIKNDRIIYIISLFS